MANTLNFTSLSRRGAYNAQVETVSAPGAISVTKRTTKLAVDGTDAFTLAAGSWVGQEKDIICSAAATSPVGAITLAVLGGNTISAFGVVGELCRLVWDGAQWLPMALSGVTVSTV